MQTHTTQQTTHRVIHSKFLCGRRAKGPCPLQSLLPPHPSQTPSLPPPAACRPQVRVLTRNTGAARSKLSYPGLEFFGPADWAKGVEGAYGVVNLAGEPIATR